MEEKSHYPLRLDRLSEILLFALVLLIPFFSLPNSFPLELDKALLIGFVVLAVFVCWLAAGLVRGTVRFPKSLVLLLGLIVFVVTLISNIFSPVSSVSFAGFGFETDTLLSVILFFLLFFLAAIFFGSHKKTFYLWGSIFCSGLIVFLLQAINLFTRIPGIGLVSENSSIVGRWNDLAIFFGFCLVASAVAIILVPLARNLQFLVWGVFGTSLISLILINYTLVWWVLLFIFAFFLVYQFFIRRNGQISDFSHSKKFILPVLVLVLAIVFIAFGREGQALDLKLENIVSTPLEVRPSWQGTFSVARESFKADPVLGVGPGRFSYPWQQYKPTPVNQSPFWNLDFSSGVGYIPTTFVTTGILGFAAWVIFVLAFVASVLRALFLRAIDGPAKSLLVLTGLSTLFLWVMAVLYIPNLTLISLAFLLTGVFVGLEHKLSNAEEINFSVSRAPTLGFISVIAGVILILMSLSGIYLFFSKARAWSFFQDGLTQTRENNLESAAVLFDRATKTDNQSLYYRSAVDVGLARLNNLLISGVQDQNVLQSQFIDLYSTTHAYALKAAEVIDPTNYLNLLTLARVYESVIPLGIEGSYETARSTYEKARVLAPRNPAIPLFLARLELSQNRTPEAEQFIGESLVLKSNYTPALFLRGQIAIQGGDIARARENTELALVSNPNDTGVLFQLGFIEYNTENFERAVAAFERAVFLDPNYSNAKYFLGLSYFEVGRKEEAKFQFEEVLELNPGNENVERILENLEAGRRPLAGFAQSELPERGSEPPITE